MYQTCFVDYIQCPYCQRRFNENAADRHINFCREQAARMPNKNKLVDAKKTPLRTQVHTHNNNQISRRIPLVFLVESLSGVVRY